MNAVPRKTAYESRPECVYWGGHWRGARVDDWGCLENSCTLRGTVGSNPTLSAE